jgi:predicted NAD/FAD-binding protein
VTGGSRRYVDAIGARLGPSLHVAAPVRSLRREGDEIVLRIGDEERRFDRVVVATHADQALALLEDPSDDERRLLAGFAYTVNDTILHTDSSFLPSAPRARASWNYRTGEEGRPTLTYYLNKLQGLDAERDYCVTLNQEVPEEHVLSRFAYAHPMYTVSTMRAQAELRSLSGARGTYWAGAHLGNGFHEDGLASGIAAAQALGVRW